ncbi:hypothetical protein SmJEL517_g01881 [Synchytrium microbalum]|uniref:Inheritance of peroxisomes protein 1 n=1 Tax=Synchytrium microbalum TaxID=1806994 RepID=A0A507C871_9FUNG|nr:uncharacterized protein SmJEL517_g01881 [Synchytrium microbalum]TPX35711.1 hypothetical protein SmJEL517_g01881 [Synchytrium microbalum]
MDKRKGGLVGIGAQTPSNPSQSSSVEASDPRPNSTTLISIPDVICTHVNENSEEVVVGEGELRIIRLTLPAKDDAPPIYDAIYLTVAESVSHPLLPRSQAWKSGVTYTFPFPVKQFYKIDLQNPDSDMAAALDDCLTHCIGFENRRKLQNSLALVDAAGEVLAVLDSDNMKVRFATNATENEKVPMVVDLGAEGAQVEIVGQDVEGNPNKGAESIGRQLLGSPSGSSAGKTPQKDQPPKKKSFWDSVLSFLEIEPIPPPPPADASQTTLRVTTLARDEANPYVLIMPADFTISQRMLGSLLGAVNTSRRFVSTRYGPQLSAASRFAQTCWSSVVETLDEVFHAVDEDIWYNEVEKHRDRGMEMAPRLPFRAAESTGPLPTGTIRSRNGRPMSIVGRPISIYTPPRVAGETRAESTTMSRRKSTMARPLSTMGRPLSVVGLGKGALGLAASLGIDTTSESASEVSMVYFDEKFLSHPAIIKGAT